MYEQLSARPGAVVTGGSSGMGLVANAGILSQVPLGRLGAPDEIAKVPVFLASDASS